MPNSDPIIWANLFSNQRDALVARHVFKRKIINWKIGRDLLMAREDNPRLSEAIPAYTESMDAVWQVLRKTVVDESIDLVLSNGLLLSQMEEWEVLQWVASWTPEQICLAALRVHGLTIDTITGKTVEEVQAKPKSVDMS